MAEDDRLVTVCSDCLCASCWQGIFYCSTAKSAGTVKKTVAELRARNFEDPHYWAEERVKPAPPSWR